MIRKEKNHSVRQDIISDAEAASLLPVSELGERKRNESSGINERFQDVYYTKL